MTCHACHGIGTHTVEVYVSPAGLDHFDDVAGAADDGAWSLPNGAADLANRGHAWGWANGAGVESPWPPVDVNLGALFEVAA